jgi:DNA-binding CsgD family transcriptional regulator
MNAQTIASKMNISETRSWELLRVLRIKFGVTTDHHVVAKYYQFGMDYQN